MRYLVVVLALCLFGLFAASVLSGPEPTPHAPAEPPQPTPYATQVAALFQTTCLDCHAGELAEAGLDLEPLAQRAEAPAPEALLAEEVRWTRIASHLADGLMPPAEVDPPDPELVVAAVEWIETALLEAAYAVPLDPGRVTIRRLNRTEYANTVRDLLDVEIDAERWLPRDEVGHGFDHIGDVLSLPPRLLEKYLDVAEHVAERAVVAVDPDNPALLSFPPSTLRAKGNVRARAGTFAMLSRSSVSADVTFPREGLYIIRARAFAQQAGPDLAEMSFWIGNTKIKTVKVDAEPGDPADYATRVKVGAGTARVAVTFDNDYYSPDDPDPKQRDRNLFVSAIEVEGPLGTGLGPPPESHRRIITAVPAEDGSDLREVADSVLRPVARRAYRRPVTDADVERLVDLVELVTREGEPFERGVQLALQALLASPHFLFRVELDANPTDVRAVHPVGEHELACRLSYFLWSSMPDAALFAAADAGTLSDEIDVHVARMLADEKARNLVTNFAAQWLQLPRLDAASPDPKRFPGFSEQLRASMRMETELFVEEILREDRSILELLVADFAWLDAPLARHYGLEHLVPATPGSPATLREAFERVELPPGGPRGGLLTQASILTLTSYPTRTSPVLRGKYVLDQLLVDPPPPPPPGVGVLEDQSAQQKRLPLRKRLALHRADPSCAVCHTRMDAIGFGLERFDAVGARRAKEGAHPIDSSGVLPDGRGFDDVRALAVLLAEDVRFPRAFAEHLLTFALGRGLESLDRRALDGILQAAGAEGWRLSAFVRAIVHSLPFRSRRGEASE